jgi:hypothetical protein
MYLKEQFLNIKYSERGHIMDETIKNKIKTSKNTLNYMLIGSFVILTIAIGIALGLGH